MKIEPFTQDRLGEIVSLSERCLPEYRFTEKTWKRCTLEDPNFDPELMLLAMEEQGLVGLFFACRRLRFPEPPETERAWLKIFFVEPRHRERGVASRLLEYLEQKLASDGIRELRVSDCASWHFFPGVNILYDDAVGFLTSRNFVKASEFVDYLVDLSRFKHPERVVKTKQMLESQGFTFRLAEARDRGALIKWVANRFGPFWSYEVDRSFQKATPTTVIAEKADRTIGFSSWSSLETEWLGPIGVSEEERRQGVGTVLLFQALSELFWAGLRIAVIPWTSQLFFYTQVPGIVGLRHYWVMTKQLSQGLGDAHGSR